VNAVLHEYGELIVGRMGFPYREMGVSIISLIVERQQRRRQRAHGQAGQDWRRVGQVNWWRKIMKNAIELSEKLNRADKAELSALIAHFAAADAAEKGAPVFVRERTAPSLLRQKVLFPRPD
jgi:hypothetical protein